MARIGVDIGGTFTDFTVLEDSGDVTLWKEDSTPQDPASAILSGLKAIAANKGIDEQALLAGTEIFVHGSTIATNAVIERSGSKVGLLCTDGFRDVLYYRDGFKWDRFNLQLERPEDIVDRHLRLPVVERINFEGNVVVPLDESTVRQAARRFADADVEAVAIAFLWSVVNPAHEQRAAEILKEELPGVPVVCSADVLPEIREWQRTSAAVLSAYALPKIDAYLRKLEEALRKKGLENPLQVMQINGGCASVTELLHRPVNSIHSGPAAAPAAALFHAERMGLQDLVTVDMGGTSFDVSLIHHGRPVMSREIEVEHQPIGVSGVEVHSIGAGGGSIAWIDTGGALRVGPKSAGSRPGPVAYGAGGTEPTVTDANVLLGYLAPEDFLGGRRRLRDDLARDAIAAKIGEPLGLNALEAAAGIIKVVDAHMIDGIRYVSVERGVDPRGFCLVSGGGAGSIHAPRLARSLGMTQVLIPREAATFCSFGMTVTDVRHDYTRATRCVSTEMPVDGLSAAFAEMEDEARARLRAEGFTDDRIVLERLVDARYLNQVHEITIPIPSGADVDARLLTEVARSFHSEHRQQFSYEIPDVPIEYLHWRVSAVGRSNVPASTVESLSETSIDAIQIGERLAYFEESGGMIPTPVFDLDGLQPGAVVAGPAILRSAVTTVVINPGDVLTAQPGGSFLIDITTGYNEEPDTRDLAVSMSSGGSE